MKSNRPLIAGIPLIGALLLVGCIVRANVSQQAAPFPGEDAIRTLPTITPTALPGPPPDATPPPPLRYGGRVGRGEIVFTRGGALWAIGPDGANERRITILEDEEAGRGAVASPDGSYVAFNIDADEVAVLDTRSGQIHSIDRVENGVIGALTWSPDSMSLYYHVVIYRPDDLTAAQVDIWQASMPPGGPLTPLTMVDLSLSPGGYTPTLGLPDGRLLLGEFTSAQGVYSRPLLFTPTRSVIPVRSPGNSRLFKIWDVDPATLRALVTDQTEGTDAPAQPLYLTDLDPVLGLRNPVRVSPEGEEVVYLAAHFAPDGQRLIAIRARVIDGQTERAEAVLFTPFGNGYRVTVLGQADPGGVVAIAWHSEQGVVVERVIPDEAGPSLWLQPLDGSPGRRIVQGEAPLVIATGR